MTNEPNEQAPDLKEEISPAKKSRAKKIGKIALIVLAVLVALLLICFAAFLIIRNAGKKSLHKNDKPIKVPTGIESDFEEDGMTVVYQGETYHYNENAVGILFLGVDKESISKDSGYGINGQADSLFLAVLDTEIGTVKIIPISREAMVDIDVYSAAGNYIGTKNNQLCLAYSYGKSGTESCENVRKAVSRLLCGINISSYVAIDLKGLKAVTDKIGGVTLNSLETMDLKGMQVQKGQQITLTGDKTIAYIRHRDDDVNANNRRMARQKQFLKAFANRAGNQIVANFSKLKTYYDTVSPYLVSDLTFSEITYLASCCLTTDIGNALEYVTVPGETVMGEKYVEFYPDMTGVYEAVLNTFYRKEQK